MRTSLEHLLLTMMVVVMYDCGGVVRLKARASVFSGFERKARGVQGHVLLCSMDFHASYITAMSHE